MRATITGATGLVGSNLAIELLSQGHQVRCTRRAGSKAEHLKAFPIEWVDADLSDQKALTRAFENTDVVFHCAAVINFKWQPTAEMVQGNVVGSENVIAAIKQARVPRLVHCSSVVATAISQDGKPVNEDQPWNFDQVGLADGYAVTKYQSQKLVVAAAKKEIDAVIVNPCYMFGPYDPKPSSGKMIIDVVLGKVPGCADGTNNFVDVRDVCRGMIAAWQRGRRGECYILGNQNLTYQEAMTMIARVAGVKPPTLKIPKLLAGCVGWFGDLKEKITGKEALVNSVTVKYGYCRNYLFSSAKAERELDYRPGPVEKAVSDAISWFRENGMLPAK